VLYLKKRTCESEDESCGDAGPEPEPVSSEGDASQVDRDSVDRDDELGEHQVDQDQIERRSELKYENPFQLLHRVSLKAERHKGEINNHIVSFY
jgi:hypothetical protein